MRTWTALIMILSFPLWAQQTAKLGMPQFSGDACRAGSVSATLSEDAQLLSLLFDNYAVEAGGNAGKKQDKKSCTVEIPIEVPQGYSVAVFKIDYRGFNSLPAGAESQFTVDHHFGGRLGPREVTSFRGPLESDFITRSQMQSNELAWSACGKSHSLRAKSTLKVQTNAAREETLSVIDSADAQAGLTYHLQWRRCSVRSRGT